MNLVREILDELFSMFAADAWLAMGILAIVAMAWLASNFAAPLVGGLVLLAGCLSVLAGTVLLAARRKK